MELMCTGVPGESDRRVGYPRGMAGARRRLVGRGLKRLCQFNGNVYMKSMWRVRGINLGGRYFRDSAVNTFEVANVASLVPLSTRK